MANLNDVSQLCKGVQKSNVLHAFETKQYSQWQGLKKTTSISWSKILFSPPVKVRKALNIFNKQTAKIQVSLVSKWMILLL